MNYISPLDVAWLFVESDNTPMHVGCVQVFDPPEGGGAEFVREVEARLRTQREFAPPFSLRMHLNGLAPPSWEETDDIDLEHHLQRWALPAPGGEAELHALVAKLHAGALDLSRPLWEFHLIEGLADGRFAMYIKTHHSIMDGVGGVRLLEAILDESPSRTDAPAPWAPHPESGQPSHLEEHGARHPLLKRVRRLVDQLEALPKVSQSLGSLAWAGLRQGRAALEAPYRAPQCALNGRVTRRRSMAAAQLPLATIKALAKGAGVTVNDVFLCVFGDALRRYLLDHADLPGESLIAGLPVSVRPEGDMSVGTAVSFIMASLATDEADIGERLALIHRSTTAAKDHLAGLNRDALTEYTLLMMAPYMVELISGLAGRMTPAFNIIISNVPGPKQTRYFNGARLHAIYPLSIVTHGQALNVTFMTYAGKLNVGFSACPERVPDLESLARYTHQALKQLRRSLKGTGD